MNDYFQRFCNYLELRRYAHRTQRIYKSIITKFLNEIDCDATDVTQTGIELYLLTYDNPYTMAQIHGCLGIFYGKVLQMDIVRYVPFPKFPKKIKVGLNQHEVQQIINAPADNIKHRLVLHVAYYLGLRVSEVVNLKLADIDFFTKQVHLKACKGEKDRIVYMSDQLIAIINTYISLKHPVTYLFNGQAGKLKYSTESCESIFHAAVEKAAIKKEVKFHSLRGAFISHMNDNGVPLNYIQEAAGHEDIRTTMTYTYTCDKVKQNAFQNAFNKINHLKVA